ncbi:AAA family ATPase [Saccharibacillus sacchari]|uniref:AAA family ATPase n=1 Tax=Saccharibacillus sacchari TaxID=456493 RepID=UPI0004AF974E|nr:ATP-binding protein [Saccharibacillus sacchari]
MNQINELYIGNYRGIKNLRLENTGAINLLVGRNNAGKTSILEAIELISAPGDVYQMVQTARGRDRSLVTSSSLLTLDSMLWAFPVSSGVEANEQIHSDIVIELKGFERDISYKISCEDTKTLVEKYQEIPKVLINDEAEEVEKEFVEARALRLIFNINNNGKYYSRREVVTFPSALMRRNSKKPIYNTKMITPVEHRLIPVSPKALTDSILGGNKEKLIQLLQDFDENIEDIEILSPDDRTAVPYFKHKYKGYLPVSIYGDGIRRVLTVATAILQARNGILLIDEIETAIHAKSLNIFFEWLVSSCHEFNVQLFATTHSLEAIDGIVSADSNHLSELIVYRLNKDRDTEETKSTRFTGETLHTIRVELGQDVRG